MSTLRERLKFEIELSFPDFRKHDTLGPPGLSLSFHNKSCTEWHQEFVARIAGNLGTGQHLPVYRMSDGEYRFALRSSDVHPSSLESFARLLYLRARGLRGAHRSGSPEYGFETYSPDEVKVARETFLQALKAHSREGIMAISLHDTKLVRPYRAVMLDWYDTHDIRVDENNHFHFYSVYVLLHGPDRQMLYNNRRVLVVTSLTPEKKTGIERGLLDAGARSVRFLEISAGKALFDRLDLSGVEPPDLTLVGAGIGSVSVMRQLRPLGSVCIDCGFCLSTLANPDLRFSRPYCVPDSEMDLARVRFLPKGHSV